MIVPVALWLSISLSTCGKALLGLAASNTSTSYGLGMTPGSGYSSDDALVGNNGCNWGVCGAVAGALCGAAAIVSRSLSSFASCLANEHSSRSKIVLISRSSSLTTSSPWKVSFWFNCYKKT